MEAGVAGERQLDGGAGDGAAHGVPVGVADDEPEQGAGGLLGGGVRVVGAGQGPTDLGGRDLAASSAASSWSRTSAALASMSSPVRTKVTSLRKPPSRLRPDLEGGRRRLAAYAVDPHPVGAVLGEPDGVEAGGDVGAGVPGALVS